MFKILSQKIIAIPQKYFSWTKKSCLFLIHQNVTLHLSATQKHTWTYGLCFSLHLDQHNLTVVSPSA